MYKNKEVKNVNNFFINVWRKNIFDIYVTEYGTAFDNYFTYFVPVFKYCYSDRNRKIVEDGTIDTPNTQIHERLLSLIGLGFNKMCQG
jgi:hypothetical protein